MIISLIPNMESIYIPNMVHTYQLWGSQRATGSQRARECAARAQRFSMLPSPLVQPSWSHPVAPVASLARAEDLAEGARADGVHSAGLEGHQNVAGHVAVAGRLEEEHGDALELEVGVAVVGAGGACSSRHERRSVRVGSFSFLRQREHARRRQGWRGHALTLRLVHGAGESLSEDEGVDVCFLPRQSCGSVPIAARPSICCDR